MGKVTWDDLAGTDNWHGVGLGGSQKCEVAYLDKVGIPYEEIDVMDFHAQEVISCEVDQVDDLEMFRRSASRTRVPSVRETVRVSLNVIGRRSSESIVARYSSLAEGDEITVSLSAQDVQAEAGVHNIARVGVLPPEAQLETPPENPTFSKHVRATSNNASAENMADEGTTYQILD